VKNTQCIVYQRSDLCLAPLGKIQIAQVSGRCVPHISDNLLLVALRYRAQLLHPGLEFDTRFVGFAGVTVAASGDSIEAIPAPALAAREELVHILLPDGLFAVYTAQAPG